MTGVALFFAVFLACAVEAVEALTITLAAGTSRDWRSALTGAGTAVSVLALLLVVLGPAIGAIPLTALRLVVGGLLLTFGIGWLRTAILRASGHKAMRDEDAAYQRVLTSAAAAAPQQRPVVGDWFAFTLAFKGVLLEGLEVVFIALTFGTNQHDVPLAAIAAITAVLVVAATGFVVRAPLARVPENAMKLVVGVMLVSFGTFWASQGAGAQWPGGDAALLGVVPALAALTWFYVLLFRRWQSASDSRRARATKAV